MLAPLRRRPEGETLATPRTPRRLEPAPRSRASRGDGGDHSGTYSSLVREPPDLDRNLEELASFEPESATFSPSSRPSEPSLDATLDAADGAGAVRSDEAQDGTQGELQQAGEDAVEELGESTGEAAEEGEEGEEGEGEGEETGGRTRRRSTAPEEEEGSDAPMLRAEPIPLPNSDPAELPTPRLQIEVRAPPYKAATELPRASTAEGEEQAQPGGADPAKALAAWADSVRFGKLFYDELVGAAREIEEATLREARQAHERLDADLSLALQTLSNILSARMGSNDQARESSIARLEGLASSLRRRIRRAARVAYGRLTAMKETYDRETEEPRGKRESMPGKVFDAIYENMTARWDAEDALDGFIESPGSQLTDGDFADEGRGRWETKAMREAAIEFIGPYATADKTAIGEREDVLYERLGPLADCLPCQIDTAFMTIDARMDYLMVAGPNSVAAAKDGAIQRVDDLVEQMRITIEEAHASTAKQLVEQHDSTRDMLIQMAAMEQQGTLTQMEAGTKQANGTLVAIAGSQSRGVEAAYTELAKSAEQPAGVYATTVMSGADRLKSNIRGMMKTYPDPQREQARKAEGVRSAQQRTAEQQRDKSLIDFDQALAESIRQTYDQVDSSTEREFQKMAKVPGQVRSTCDETLARAEEARVTDVGNLVRAINDLDGRVDATIAGTAPPESDNGEGEGEGDGSDTGTTPDAGSGSETGTGEGEGGGGGGEPMAPPASCAGCEQEEDSGEDTERDPDEGTDDSGSDSEGDGDAPEETDAPDGTEGESDNYLSSPDFRRYAGEVTTDPKKGNSVASFLDRVQTQVSDVLTRKENGCYSALDYSWRKPNVTELMQNLRGLTATSGRALEEVYTHGSLRNHINEKFDDMFNWTLSAPSTVEFNRNAALQALSGDVGGAALNELRASINYSNEDSRIREVMQSLTPAQLRGMSESELDAIAADLEGENLERFEALRRGDGGLERAITLRDEINAAGGRYGTDRGRMTQEAIAKARTTGGLPIEGDPEREMADIFGLEHPEAVAGRREAQWHSTLQNFANLRQVQYTLQYQDDRSDPTGLAPELSEEQRRNRYREPFRHDDNFAEGKTDTELENILLRFAAADRYTPHARGRGTSTAARTPPGYTGESSGVADRPGRLPPDMVNWIEQTIRHGPDSTEERGARMLVEFNRADARGSAERLDDALHIGSADAQEGGGYQPRDVAGTQEERDRVLAQFAQYRTTLGGDEAFMGPIDPRQVERDLRERYSTALRNDDAARGLALGIIGGEEGDAIAAMEYAIDRGDKEIALRYLRRMDRRQIDAMMEEYDEAHPNGPSLYERLGLFQHHGMGAAFSGDEALEIEIAAMGVPQNDRESAEVALRRMDQQIDHSTGAGQAVASDEFNRLEGNRDRLRQLMGITGSDIDELGRIRLEDDEGNPVHLGNFNADGSFRATPGASMAQFQRAMTRGKLVAENFTRAVDEAANFLTTMLAVVAAVVITIATAGAASILLPMLLTAAIGLAGVGMTWALKGGRYSRDDLTRDLANVAVQTLVAGVGAAAGLYMRAGAAGGRAVGTMMGRLSMSEGRLAAQLGMKELAKLTLRQELMLGALTGVLGNVGGAMADPKAWREGRVGNEIWHGMWRGAVSGMIGSAAMRPLGRLGNDASLGTQIAARSALNGVSNSATKAWDLAYDANRGAYTGSLDDALGEIATAGATGVVQGGFEAAGESFGQNNRRLQNFHDRESASERRAARRAAPETANDNDLPPPEGARPSRPDAPDAEPVEAPARLRSALGGEDEPAPRLRSGGFDDDEVTQPGIRIEHPTFPEGVNLQPGDLDHLPPILPDTVVRGVDPTDAAQARQNYDMMRARTPDSEVLLAFHPATGEYMAVQGLPHSVTPPPEGWITLRHSHPRQIGGDQFSQLAAVLPSGIGGDFSVLRTEVERMAALSPGVEVRRASVIDIEVDGQHVQTVFQITKDGDNYTLQVTLHPPIHGVEGVGPVSGNRDTALREYAYQARDLTSNGSDFGLGHNPRSRADLLSEGGRPDAPSRVVRGATLGEVELSDAMFAGRRMAQADDFDAQARGAAPRGELDPVIARAATSLDAQERVRAMGLVGQPDSLERLTRLLNSSNQDLTPEMRSGLARAALEATRSDLIRAGNLAPGDELVMLFRGVPGSRTDDYERGGMDIRQLGPGGDEDAGRGLYGSQDFQSALNYAGTDGQGVVLPLIVRSSELGNVIDVRTGTPLGERWLDYIRATASGGVVKESHPHLGGVLYPMVDSPIGIYRDGRGDRYEAFLRTLADDPTLPPEIREAARDPHITLMDLGGVASWGNDRSMLTDQFAMHHQRILDLFNEAHGFPRPSAGTLGGTDEGPVRLRSALSPDETATPATPHPDAEAQVTPENTTPETATPRPPDAEAVDAAVRDLAEGEEALANRPKDDAEDVEAELATTVKTAVDDLATDPELPPAQRVPFEEADAPERLRQAREAIDHLRLTHPDQAAFLDGLSSMPEAMRDAAVRAIFSSQAKDRAQAIRDFETFLKSTGVDADTARQALRNVVDFTNYMSERLNLSLRHVAERELWKTSFDALPVSVRGLAQDSNLLHFVGAKHPDLLIELHAKFAADTPDVARQTTANFEEYVAKALTEHKEVQAETVGRRIVRFDSIDDFNLAASSAAPHTRYEFERLAFTTDAEGRVVMAEGVAERHRGKRDRADLQREIGHSGDPGDVGFHLLAHIFGGPVNELNVVAGNGKPVAGDPGKNLNGSAYKVEFENIVRNILDNHDDIVEVQVEPIYDGASRRPDRIQVKFRTDAGDWIVVPVFLNRPGGGR